MSETDLEFLDLTDTTALRWSAVRVRVSAPLRRGAAPYADGSQRSQTRSRLILCSWGGAICDTMVPLPQRAPLVNCLQLHTPPFRKILLQHARRLQDLIATPGSARPRLTRTALCGGLFCGF